MKSSFVYHVFAENSKPVAIDVRGLSKDDLREYVVTKDGAMELVFRNAGKDHESQLFFWSTLQFSLILLAGYVIQQWILRGSTMPPLNHGIIAELLMNGTSL